MKFSERLKRLGFDSYNDYLSSAHWNNFKRRYKKSGARMTCLVCGSKPIQLHHHTYERLGQESIKDIDPLCGVHHEAVHQWLKENNKYVDKTRSAIKFLKSKIQLVIRNNDEQLRKDKSNKEIRRKLKLEKRAEKRKLENELGKAQIPELISKLESLPLTKKQIKRISFWEKSGDFRSLRSLYISLTAIKKEKKQKQPQRFNKNHQWNWNDPLQAIRMLSVGQQIPYRQRCRKMP